MVKEVSYRQIFILFLVVLGIGAVLQLMPTHDIQADISCDGWSDRCNIGCSASASVSENDHTWIWSVWRGSYYAWDDTATFSIGYNRSNPSESWSSTDSRPVGGCSCGSATGCPGEAWPLAFSYFSSARATLPGNDYAWGSVNALNKHIYSANPFKAQMAWDYATIDCSSTERTNDTYSGCVSISGNLSASPTSCSAPCAVNFSWNSNTKGSSNVTLGGSEIASGSTSGSSSRTFSSAGSYTLNLNAQSGWGNMVNNINSVTINVTNPIPPVSCSFSPSSVQANQSSTATATGGNGSYSWSAPGGSPSSGSGSSFSVSYGTPNTYNVQVTSAGQSGQCSVTVTPSAPTPSGSISASPNPITGICSPDTTGVTTLNVTSNVSYIIKVNNPSTGSAMTGVEPAGTRSHTTGDWVNNGMWFFLVKASDMSVLDSVQVVVNSNGCPSAPTVDLNANPLSITSGSSSTLSWTSSNATSCTASGGWSGSKATSGSQSTGALTNSTTYTLSCTGPGGTAMDSVTVSVGSPGASVSLTASPTSISSGGSSTLTWTVSNATSCTASGGWSGSKSTSGGSQSVGPLYSTTTFTLACSNSTSSSATSATVTVSASPAPTATVSASPTSVSPGGSSSLSWSCTNSSPYATLTPQPSGFYGGNPNVGQSGLSTGSLSNTTTYTLTCTGPGGTATDSVTVTVSGGSTLTCSPGFTSANISQAVNFTATGGSGSGVNYSWTAPTAGITSGTGTFFTTYFNTAGNHIVQVTNSGNTAGCFVSVNTVASDLSITDFHLTDAFGNTKTSFTPGERVYPSVTIRNNSSNPTQSSTGYFYVSLYSNRPSIVPASTGSDVNVWATDYSVIPAGGSKTYSVTQNSSSWSNQYWTMGSTGSFTARAFVDSFVMVTETNENNNQATSGYTISNVSPPILQVTPTSLSYTANVGSNPANQTLTIANTGGQNLTWNGSDNQTWISLGTASGTLSPSASQNVSVSINTAGMSAGNYSGAISITSNGGNLSIPVSLSIGSPCTTPGPGTNRMEGCVYQGTNLVSLHSNAPTGPTASSPADNFSALNMSWGAGGPNGLSDNFSVRWRGTFTFTGGDYRFTVTDPDDGFRVFVDSNQLSPESEWTTQCCGGAHTYSANGLSAGSHTVTLEYFEQGGGANINLSWAKVASTPTLTFTASPATINSGQSSTLTWSSTNATSCTASGGWSGAKALSGTQSVSPASTTTYNLSCVGPGGTVNQSATVTVNVVNPDPDVTIRVNRVNGSTSFSLADVRDGDVLQFAMDFRNGSAGGPATGFDSGDISLSNNLVNPTNFTCPPVFSGTTGNFSVTTPIIPGGSAVTCTFDVTVQATTNQQRELTTVGVTGNYNPGNVLFSDTFSLLITPKKSADPDFIEVPPN